MVSVSPVDHLEHELAVLLRRARAISAQLARNLHPDLEPGAYGLMLRLSEPGEARATDLAAFLGIGKPTISRQLATLEGLGLVVRAKDVDDARAQVVSLTPAGIEQLDRVRALRQAHMRQILDQWDDADVDLLASLIGRYNALQSQPERPAVP